MANFPKQPPSIGRSQALTGATGATGSAGGINSWLDVTQAPYSADPTGSVDSSAGIQAAINVAKVSGGVVYLPAGNYLIGTSLNADNNTKSWTLRGPGGGAQFQEMAANLIYTGTATGITGGLLHLKSGTAFELCYLGFAYNNAGGSFTGDLVNIDGTGGDCQDFHVHHCTGRALATNTARSIVRLSRAVIGTIELCHWTGALNPLRVGDPGGAYVNVLQIEKCTFNFSLDAHILIGSGDAETVTIRDCTFEAGTNTTGIRGATTAVDGAPNNMYNPIIEGNWFGDASTGTVWIDGLTVISNSYTGLIQGNRFASAHTGGTHLNLGGLWMVTNNSFEGGDQVYDSPAPTHLQLLTFGNEYNGPFTSGSIFNPTNFPSGVPSRYVSLGNVGDPNGDQISFSGQTMFGVGASLTDIGGSRGVIIGTNQVAGYIPLPTSQAGAIYRGLIPNTTRPSLMIQAPWGGTTSDGVMLAGATPQPMLQWQDNAFALFGMAPTTPAILNAHAVTIGYTAGAGTAVTIDGKFTGNVGMLAPVNFAATAVASGGTFTAGTYFWKITALNAAGETLPSVERSATIVLNGSANLAWSRVFGATSYKIYRATSAGAENVSPALVTTIGSGSTITFTDTGAATSAGNVPAASTALTGYTPADIVAALKNIGAIPG